MLAFIPFECEIDAEINLRHRIVYNKKKGMVSLTPRKTTAAFLLSKRLAPQSVDTNITPRGWCICVL